MKSQTSIILSAAIFLVICTYFVQGKPQGPEGQDGCYWTDCTSPFTYDLKCRTDFNEQPNRDESGCDSSLVKYQCCPVDSANIPAAMIDGESAPSNDSQGAQPV